MSESTGDWKEMNLIISTQRIYLFAPDKKKSPIKRHFSFKQLLGVSIGVSD